MQQGTTLHTVLFNLKLYCVAWLLEKASQTTIYKRALHYWHDSKCLKLWAKLNCATCLTKYITYSFILNILFTPNKLHN